MLNLGMTADAAAAHEHEHGHEHEHEQHQHHPPQSASPASAEPSAGKAAQTRTVSSLLGLPLRLMAPGRRDKTASSTSLDAPAPAPTPSKSTSAASSPRGSIEEPERTDQEIPAATSRSERTNQATLTATTPAQKQQPQQQQPRPKTSFHFAHPPPSSRRQILRLRPRLLLQLHQVSLGSRPIPALDVIPATMLGKLAVGRRFSTTVSPKDKDRAKGKEKDSSRTRPSATDLTVVASDRYEPVAAADEDRSTSSGDEGVEDRNYDGQRRPLATLRHCRKEDLPCAAAGTTGTGFVDIHVNEGGRWTVSPLPQGGYEFTACDAHGVKRCVRWVLRNRSQTNRLPPKAAGTGLANEETGITSNNNNNNINNNNANNHNKRFAFSVIDPRTRRHPIIAWMSRRGIDVLDQYATSATVTTPPAAQDRKVSGATTSSLGRSTDASAVEQALVDTDENLRMLIVTTGLWTAFREGWATTPLNDDGSMSASSSSPVIPSSALNSPTVLQPSSPAQLPSINPSSPEASHKATEKRPHGGSSLQQLFGLGRGNRSSMLRRSGSHTAESWKSAANVSQEQATPSPTPDADQEQQPAKSNHRRGRSTSLRYPRDVEPSQQDGRGTDKSRSRSAAAKHESPLVADTAGQGQTQNSHSHSTNGKVVPGTEGNEDEKGKKGKKNWLQLSGWLDMKSKKKKRPL